MSAEEYVLHPNYFQAGGTLPPRKAAVAADVKRKKAQKGTAERASGPSGSTGGASQVVAQPSWTSRAASQEEDSQEEDSQEEDDLSDSIKVPTLRDLRAHRRGPRGSAGNLVSKTTANGMTGTEVPAGATRDGASESDGGPSPFCTEEPGTRESGTNKSDTDDESHAAMKKRKIAALKKGAEERKGQKLEQ